MLRRYLGYLGRGFRIQDAMTRQTNFYARCLPTWQIHDRSMTIFRSYSSLTFYVQRLAATTWAWPQPRHPTLPCQPNVVTLIYRSGPSSPTLFAPHSESLLYPVISLTSIKTWTQKFASTYVKVLNVFHQIFSKLHSIQIILEFYR
jgi:hypothetical protein